MHKSYYIILTLCSLCAVQADAQSVPVAIQLQDSHKDTLRTISPILLQKVQEALMQSISDSSRADTEITQLTNTILHKNPISWGLRPFALRLDSTDELQALASDGIALRLAPEPLLALMKPQPFTYNMSKANMNGAFVGIHCWDVMRVREFYVTDYDIATDTDWFWAEDWR